LPSHAFSRSTRKAPRSELLAALRALDQFLWLEPTNLTARALRGHIRTVLGREDAKVDLNLVDAIRPNQVWVALSRAIILCRNRRIEEAYQVLESCPAKRFLILYVPDYSDLAALSDKNRWSIIK
jgi:predicted Zn-dependent protease